MDEDPNNIIVTIEEEEKDTTDSPKNIERMHTEEEEIEKEHENMTLAKEHVISPKLTTLPSGENLDSHSEKELSKIKPEIYQKVSNLSHLYLFSQAYSNDVVLLFKKLNDVIFKKVNNTLNQNKNFLKFFKEVTVAYQKFSGDLIKANSTITSSIVQDQIFNDSINNVIEKTQETIANNFYNFSNVIQSNIISQGPFNSIGNFYPRLEKIQKELQGLIEMIEKRKEKITKVFNTKYAKSFSEFKSIYKETESANQFLIRNDFFLIELDLVSGFNKLYANILKYETTLKEQITNIKQLLIDYVTIVKQTIEIYIKENQKIFAGNMNLNFEIIQKFYDGINKDTLEKSLSLKNLLREPEHYQQFNEIFKSLQTILVKYHVVKDESIYKEENFNMESYQTMEDFIQFMIRLTPGKMDFTYNLVDHIFELKRDPGLFKSWKHSILVLTKQHNAILFDDKIMKKSFLNMISLKRAKIKYKEEKKFPYRFELQENKKAFMFTTSINFILDAESKEKFEEILRIIENEGVLYTEDSSSTSRRLSKDSKDSRDPNVKVPTERSSIV
jgi:hypothetical protein